jgi:2,3-bisphosphoglycerate-dependent phosphoglycerate mutase
MDINNFVKWEGTLKMPTVLFIRHAESEANAGQPTAHPATIKITSKGMEQADSIASFFTREPNLIITSPYKRTIETAQPTFARFPHAPHEEWPVEEFTYLAPLDTLTTSIERKPMVEAFWQQDDPSYVDGDKAESFAAFIGRVQDVIKRLRQTKKDYITVFSHEQFICAIQWLFLKDKLEPGATLCSNGKKQFKDFLTMCRLPNGAILSVHLQDGDETWIRSIITSHLSP